MSSPEASPAAEAGPLLERGAIAHHVNRLCARLHGKGASPGDLAALRRIDDSGALPLAFWRTMADLRIPNGSDREERLWAEVLHLLAILEGRHKPGLSLGRALAESKFSELRLNRLLRAEDAPLRAELRAAARFLASKAVDADLSELAALLLLEPGSEGAEGRRRRIARDYFSALNATDKKED